MPATHGGSASLLESCRQALAGTPPCWMPGPMSCKEPRAPPQPQAPHLLSILSQGIIGHVRPESWPGSSAAICVTWAQPAPPGLTYPICEVGVITNHTGFF